MRARISIYVLAAAVLLAVVLAALRVGEEEGQLSGWQALVLGVVQGLTEFLPISSSGHLILVPWLADWTYLKENDAFNATFDVGLHIGTLVAVMAYFDETSPGSSPPGSAPSATGVLRGRKSAWPGWSCSPGARRRRGGARRELHR